MIKITNVAAFVQVFLGGIREQTTDTFSNDAGKEVSVPSNSQVIIVESESNTSREYNLVNSVGRKQYKQVNQQSKVGLAVAISTSSKASVMSDKIKPVSSTSFTAISAGKCDAGTEILGPVRADLLDHPDDDVASVNGVLQPEQQHGLCQVRLHRKIISISTHFLLTDQQIKHPVSPAQGKGQ